MLDQASQINGRLDTRVTATNHCGGLALVKGAITVRAICHTAVAVFLLTGHTQLAPTGTRRQHHSARLEGGTIRRFDLMLFARNQFLSALYIHDVDIIITYVLFYSSCKLWPLSVFH